MSVSHTLTRLLVVLGAAGAATALAVGTSSAQPLTSHVQLAYSITGTTAAGAGLNAHLDPNGAAGPIAGGQVVAPIPVNSTVYIDCAWYDANETGPWGTTNVWDLIEGYRTNGTYHDLTGYAGQAFVSDAWVNTGGNTADMVTPCFGY